jgi:O-antigen/teichoic acid export membrane protein
MMFGRSALLYATLFNRVLTIGVQIVIGSLLKPAEVGTFALAAAYCTLLSPFQSADLTRLSLQLRDHVVEAAGALRNWLLLGCALALAAVLIARPLWPDSVDTHFVAVLILLPFLRVMGNARVAVLSSQGAVEKVAIATVAEGVSRGASVVGFAFLGWGAASLLAAEVLAVATSTAALVCMASLGRRSSWRLNPVLRPKLALSAFANVLMLVEREYSTFVIGTFCSVGAAGSFYFANRVAGQLALILGPLITVEVIPRLVQAVHGASRSVYLEARRQEAQRLLRWGAVAFVALGLLAPLAIRFIWGERWQAAAWMLPPMALAAALRLVYSFPRAELEAHGNMRAMLILSAVDALMLVMLETIGALVWDASGVIVALLCETVVMILIARQMMRARIAELP